MKVISRINQGRTIVITMVAISTLLFLSGCGGGSEELSDAGAPIVDDTPAQTPVGDINTLILPVAEESIIDQGEESPVSLSFSLLSASGETVAQQNMAGEAFVQFDLGEIAYEPLTIDAQIDLASETTRCKLNDTPMGRVGESNFRSVVQPAYFRQSYLLECTDPSSDAVDGISKVVSLVSTKDDLTALFQLTLALTPDYGSTQSNTDNSPRHQRNYYYEINNLLNLAAIYTTPEDFGIEPNDPVLIKLESYLIVASEYYFQPCYEYDFYNDEPKSCRSEFKENGFYLWRSPLNNTPQYRTSHYKVEWRSAAGVAQAVKAILLKHEDDNRICTVSDIPTSMREQSIACRAKNLRKMIEEHVWRKWQSEIDSTDVMHYVAWLELIVDMFNSTAHIEHDYGCTSNCYQPSTKASLMERLLDYVTIEDGYLNISCRPVGGNNQSCVWREYDFGLSKSNDLSHLSIPMFVFYQSGQAEICNTNGNVCYRRDALIHTLKERTWAPEPLGLNAINFPKFDMFLNGYCKENFDNTNSGLLEYCREYWVNETVVNNANRELYGLVNFGAYDPDLQLMLLQAADVNKDSVIDSNDVLARGYVAFLYRAMLKPKSL